MNIHKAKTPKQKFKGLIHQVIDAKQQERKLKEIKKAQEKQARIEQYRRKQKSH